MDQFFSGDASVWHWIPALSVLTGAVLIGFLVRLLVVRKLRAAAARTATVLDDLLVEALGRRLPIWFALGGLVAGARLSPLPERPVLMIDRVSAALLIVSMSFAATHLLSGFFERHVAKDSPGAAVTSLSRGIMKAVILLIGLMLVLANLGISITPLLTALGVGSLAVALALQPMLSNMFAGFHLTMARPIRVGDMITLEGGLQGQVQDIGWRVTRIIEPPNNLIIIPNNKLSEMILVNQTLPDPSQALVMRVGVGYESDLDKVERAFLEVARQVAAELPGAVTDPEPQVRFESFGESAITVVLVVRVREVRDRIHVSHELIKRIKARCESDGIDIPVPRREVSGEIKVIQVAS